MRMKFLKMRPTMKSALPREKTWLLLSVVLLISGVAIGSLSARPAPKGKKGSETPQNFLRQTNTYSNIEFFFTNRGVLFNSGSAGEGLFWPRGSKISYIFGEGPWFATKKEVGGRRRKLCELGYNPNSGAGWYMEGDSSQVGLVTGTDGATPAAKYISYVSPRYDRTSGKYIPGTSKVVPSPTYSWPLWDADTGLMEKPVTKFMHNFYFGDYIFDVTKRNVADLSSSRKVAKPAIISEEDIVNIYTDADHSNNPEFKAGTGYPFGLNFQEVIYSWSFGRYRDMMFVRQKVTNSTQDSLLDCWFAPAFDPDLESSTAANQDANSYVSDSLVHAVLQNDPSVGAAKLYPQIHVDSVYKLNMGYQYHQNAFASSGQYGDVGFSFLEGTVIDANGNIIPNDDSVGLGGYGGSGSKFANPQFNHGLVTFRKWTIDNDPPTQDLRYDFVSSMAHDGAGSGYADVRLLMATGPFTLPPGRSVETTIGVTFAQGKDARTALFNLLLLTDFAHEVFQTADTVPNFKRDTASDGTITLDTAYSFDHFLSPVPPNIPNLKAQALDRAVLLTWYDSIAEHSTDFVSGLHNLATDTTPYFVPGLGHTVTRKDSSLSFLGYQLWRSTRSDHDSTIRPDGNNPDVMLGQWQLYDYEIDSVFDKAGHLNHFVHKRTNDGHPHTIPHSYLDVGDDNHDGILTGNEGLFNNVKYYYYLLAYDEYDSVNQVGPLFTAVVPPKNFLLETPANPVILTPFSDNSSNDITGSCAGGLKSIRLDIVDTGRFAQLFTSDTITVKFQPKWVEFNTHDLSSLYEFISVTDSRNGLNLSGTSAYQFPPSGSIGPIIRHVKGTITPDSTFLDEFTTDNQNYAPNQVIDQTFRVLVDMNFEQLSAPYLLNSVTVQSSNNTDQNILRLSRRTARPFVYTGPISANGPGGADTTNQATNNIFHLWDTITHVANMTFYDTTVNIDGAITQTSHNKVRPYTHIQSDDHTPEEYYSDSVFARKLAYTDGFKSSIISYVDRQVSGPTTTSTNGDSTFQTSVVEQRDTIISNMTRPTFIGGLGEATYEVTFDKPTQQTVVLPGNAGSISPNVLPMHITLAGCGGELKHSVDSANDFTREVDSRYYVDTKQSAPPNVTTLPAYDDPDTMWVPNPGWFQMVAYHYADRAPFDQNHSAVTAPIAVTKGPYYWPMGSSLNVGHDTADLYHLVVHRLRLGGAEFIFNAPEINSLTVTGDSLGGIYAGDAARGIPGNLTPHTRDFNTGDKITISFKGITTNLPFPHDGFRVITRSGPQVDFANSSLYTGSVLNEVQVVPNPYIVTHMGQTSTDNAKLYFTRLPPRATIEIYALDGTLINTIEHKGYVFTTSQDPNNPALTDTKYDFSQLGDRSSVEEWNLLTSGKQRVGSQVLIARVIAKDANTDAEIAETTKKFAIVVGISK